ncbi:DUF1043 family protein [Salinisphaera sp. S4-8]|uniref:ZapG family protein n=1 Tax=Salinisphaera sp. S4-8 TaxID=633357 RepID=UPI003342ADA6
MANLSPIALILIVVVCAVVALVVGYFLGSRFGGKKSVAMREATEKHDSYKNDVREHFEQTSAIMSRMVDDYRDMYQHMAEGAEKLAEMHPEKLVTPPPAPEAITRDSAADKPSAKTQAAQSKQGSAGKASDAKAQPKPAAASQKTATDSQSSEPAKAAESGTAVGKARDKKPADSSKAGVADKPDAAAKGTASADVKAKDAPNRDSVMNSDSSNDRPWNKEEKAKDGKRYGLE